MTLGVPRLVEIIDCTRAMKRPSATVFLREPFARTERGAALARRSIEYVTLARVVERAEVLPEQGPSADADADADERLMRHVSALFDARNADARCSRYTIRYTLNKAALIERHLTPADVARRIEQRVGALGVVQSSEYNAARWVVRVRPLDALPERFAATPATPEALLAEHAVVERLRAALLRSVPLAGIAGITRAVCSKADVSQFDAQTGAHSLRREYLLETEGCALLRLLGAPCVDSTRTYCNDIHEVANVLGIEAAVAMLHHELRAVIAHHGTYVSDRYLFCFFFLLY